MIEIRKFKLRKNLIRRCVKTFSLCIGITAVCMLGTIGIADYYTGSSSRALEASVFNSVKLPNANTLPQSGKDMPEYVIPMGSAFGIRLFTDGVIVASLSEIYTSDGARCPAAEAGIVPGDYILKANGITVRNNEGLARIIESSQGEEVSLTVKRGEQVFDAYISPVFSSSGLKSGMWIRDSAAGIGILTFYDPQNDIFVGLGHGICDVDTSAVMNLREGEPADITLCGIVRGAENEPGQLRGYFTSDESMGTITANTETGVYGKLFDPPEGNAIKIAKKDEIKKGDIQILTTIDDSGPALYDAEIEKIVSENTDTKNFVVKITDEKLLEATGGIIQGMSGSPILQNGKLIGAVTHVLVNDPSKGYGIFIENMLNRAE